MTENFDRLPFTPEEYLGRRDALRSLMRERGIDVIVVTATANTYYLTGFGCLAQGASALVMRSDGRAVWVMRRAELSNIRILADQLWANEGLGVSDGEDFSKVLDGAIIDLAGTNAVIAVDFAATIPSLRSFIGPRIDRPKLVDGSGLVEYLRRIKSPAELALMREAGAITAKSCQEGFEALEEGMTDTELAAIVLQRLLLNGSGRFAQMPNIRAGRRTARMRAPWCGAPIRRGDVVLLEPSASVSQYHTPMLRNYAIGRPDDMTMRMFDACRASLDEGFARVRPGMTSHEAARIFETVLEKAGFAENMVTRPAYGIGAAFPPGWGEDTIAVIRAGSEQVLEEGMCLHVVPCLFMDGVGSVGAGMPAVLTATGFQSLSGDEAILKIK